MFHFFGCKSGDSCADLKREKWFIIHPLLHAFTQPCHEMHHESMFCSEGRSQQHLCSNKINQKVTKKTCKASDNTGEKYHKILGEVNVKKIDIEHNIDEQHFTG